MNSKSFGLKNVWNWSNDMYSWIRNEDIKDQGDIQLDICVSILNDGNSCTSRSKLDIYLLWAELSFVCAYLLFVFSLKQSCNHCILLKIDTSNAYCIMYILLLWFDITVGPPVLLGCSWFATGTKFTLMPQIWLNLILLYSW